MAQTPAIRRAHGAHLDYTPGSPVTAGDVLVLNGRVRVAERDIAASTPGAVAIEGIFRFPKSSDVFAEGLPTWWNPTGTPVTGTASSGALQNSAVPGYTFAGFAIPGANAAAGDSYVDVRLPDYGDKSGSRNVAATGSVIANAAALGTGSNWVTAADGTKGVQLPAPVAGLNEPIYVKNDDTANAILKVYPPVAGTINALSANTAISMAAKTAAVFLPTPTGWFTVPLLPS